MMNPLFIDGPLRGKNIQLADGTRYYYAIDEDKSSMEKGPEFIKYSIYRLGFICGGTYFIIWLAYCGTDEPEAEAVSEYVLSDSAKEARCDK